MNIFAKVFAWVAGVFGGVRAAHAVAGNPAAGAITSLMLMGAQSALASAPHLTAAEKAGGADVLNGVAVASDPSTYANALTDAVAGSGLTDVAKNTLAVGINFAAATAVAATAPAEAPSLRAAAPAPAPPQVPEDPIPPSDAPAETTAVGSSKSVESSKSPGESVPTTY